MNQILVTNDNLTECFEDLINREHLGLDTETYGLRKEDDMFSLQIAHEDTGYYFNFLDYGEGGPHVWDTRHLLKSLEALWKCNNKTWFIHNAKFDLHKLHNFNTSLSGTIHCTQAIERLIYNQLTTYSLARLARIRGLEKDSSVDEYITKEKLKTKIQVLGKKRPIVLKHFDQVPFEKMFRYGCQDAWLHYKIGMDQLEELPKHYDKETLFELYKTTTELTRTCLIMEINGVKIDEEYTKKAQEFELGCLEDAQSEASELAGEEYRNGPKWLAGAFDRCGQAYDINPKTSNPIFDKDALAKMQSPIAEVVREIRTREKYIGTYYSSFLHYADSNSIVRANIRQAGTDTGRFSYSDPNLQNVPKEEDFEKGSVQVRKCFVPREGCCFVMIDYDQQEYRLMLDYAGDHDMINKIVHEGQCVHQLTADMMGVTRTYAKRLNFGLLYGMGVEELANSLGCSVPDAREYRRLYFSRLPHVQRLIDNVKKTAKMRKYIKTWTGRKLHFPQANMAYKAPNHLIQGGCADIIVRAMNEIQTITIPYYDANMLIQVHDELVFEIQEDQLDIVADIQKVMENIYRPMNGMKLTCGVEYSWESWGKQDAREGYPIKHKGSCA